MQNGRDKIFVTAGAVQKDAGQMVRPAFFLFFAWLGVCNCGDCEEIFLLRARVARVQEKTPAAGQEFHVAYGGSVAVAVADAWTPWVPCTQKMWDALRREYPNNGRTNPMVFWLNFKEAIDTTDVEVEVKFPAGSKTVHRMPGELFGKGMGLAIYTEDGKRKAASFAQYNRRFWAGLEGGGIPEGERPRKFPIVDSLRTRGGSNRLTFREGFAALARAGFNVLGPEVHQPQVTQELKRLGITRTGGGTFSAPGWVCSYGSEADVDRQLEKWADAQAAAFRKSGWDPRQVETFAIIDEPHWQMPGHLKGLRESPDGMKRFRGYLRSQGLAPADLGAAAWEKVTPLSKNGAVNLAGKRLFYWSMRFATWDSCRHLGLVTKKMEKAFYPGVGVFANWNNFKGRFYVPAGGGGATMHHDWIEFGRLGGANILWTEDWYASGWQWPFWCAKLAAGARRGGLRYGGYIVPRSYGDDDAIIQSILGLVGNGAKALQYFIFGPEYIFPANCYSFKAHKLLPRMARAHHMIGKAEDLLWPGERPVSEVAMLFPMSPQVWDRPGPFDATNTLVYFKTMSYLGELYSQFFSLLRFNVPVDFVEERDLNPRQLAPYKVVYVTSPDVPVEYQEGLLEWVRQGGTLVTCYGALLGDRYNEPSGYFERKTGVRQKDTKRPIAYKVFSLERLRGPDPKKPWPTGEHGEFCILGFRGNVECEGARVLGNFLDGSPAIIEKPIGRGRIIHSAFFPGMSYFGNQFTRMSDWITYPVRSAGIRPLAEVGLVDNSWPQVEAPVLLSDKGAVVTLINRTRKDLEDLKIRMRLPFRPRKVESISSGPVNFKTAADGSISFSLRLNKTADILKIRR